MLYRDCRPGGQLFIGDTTLTALEKQGSTLCFRLDTPERLDIVSGHAYIQHGEMRNGLYGQTARR